MREKLVLIGGITGALLAIYAVTLYHALTTPQMLRDGQYAMIFMFVCPPGYFAGSLFTFAAH